MNKYRVSLNNNIRNKRGDISTEPTDIKKYCEQPIKCAFVKKKKISLCA